MSVDQFSTDALTARVDRLERDGQELRQDIRKLSDAVSELSKAVALLAQRLATSPAPTLELPWKIMGFLIAGAGAAVAAVNQIPSLFHHP